MIYRRANLHDAEAIARVHVAGWRLVYRGAIADALLDSLDVAKRTQSWQQQLEDDSVDVFIAADGSEMRGFCSCGPPRNTDETPGAWELRSIYLLPAHHRKGIGKTLFELAVESSRQHHATTMILWVAEMNESARDFYASQGMVTDGVVRAHAVGDGAVLQRIKYALHWL